MLLLTRLPFEPRPKSSGQTKLVEQHPLHVVCAWLGNTPAVAQRHHLQVHDSHFERAAGATQTSQNPTQHAAEWRRTEPQAQQRAIA